MNFIQGVFATIGMMFKVKISNTPHSREQGLMFVKDMPDDEGMLFVFDSPRKLSFWGKNTFIPLDIAFLDSHMKVQKISKIKPHSLDSVPSIKECQYALEVNEGALHRAGVSLGSILDIRAEGKSALVSLSRLNKQSVFAQLDSTDDLKPKSQINTDLLVDEDPIEESSESENLPEIDVDDLKEYLVDNDVLDDEEIDDDSEETEPQVSPWGESTEETGDLSPIPEESIPVFDNSFAAINWATSNRSVMRITYTTLSGKTITRDVEPHGTFHARTTMREIMVTWDRTVGDIRAYIVTHISKWSFTEQRFEKKFIVRH